MKGGDVDSGRLRLKVHTNFYVEVQVAFTPVLRQAKRVDEACMFLKPSSFYLANFVLLLVTVDSGNVAALSFLFVYPRDRSTNSLPVPPNTDFLGCALLSGLTLGLRDTIMRMEQLHDFHVELDGSSLGLTSLKKDRILQELCRSSMYDVPNRVM